MQGSENDLCAILLCNLLQWTLLSSNIQEVTDVSSHEGKPIENHILE